MAKSKGTLLSGAFGPYVFKIVNGKQIVCQKEAPGTRKHAAASIRTSQGFGRGSLLGKQLRKTLDAQYNGLFVQESSNAIVGGLNTALVDSRNSVKDVYKFHRDSFKILAGLEFNLKSKVRRQVSLSPKVKLTKNVLSVIFAKMEVPDQFKFPRKSITCEIVVALSLFRLHDGLMVDNAETQTIFVNKSAGVVGPHTFEFDVPPGCLCVVSIFLNYATAYKGGWKILKDHKFSPGYICDAVVTPGKYQNSDDRIWRPCIKFN